MALIKKDAAAAADSKTVATQEPVAPGKFETDEITKATPAQVEAAGVAAGTAIANAKSTAVAAPRGPMKTVLQDLRGALPAVDFGVLPRLIGSNGNVLDSDKKPLGGWVKLKLISWDAQFVVSPGDDSDEAKALVRYSRDGVTIDETGEDVKAYLERLRTVEGFTDASVKEYCELIGILEASEKANDAVGGMVQVSLSPQSRKGFEAYRLQRSVLVQMGRTQAEGSENLKITAELKTFGSNTFTLLKIAADA